jgi:hypothetical protein
MISVHGATRAEQRNCGERVSAHAARHFDRGILSANCTQFLIAWRPDTVEGVFGSYCVTRWHLSAEDTALDLHDCCTTLVDIRWTAQPLFFTVRDHLERNTPGYTSAFLSAQDCPDDLK